MAVDAGHVRLPVPARPLIGRAHEIDEARRMLLDDGARLLTLTGPGGVGKTRLALAIAASVDSSIPEGACFVDLSPIRDPALVVPAIARACGLIHEPADPPIAGLIRALHHRRLLLVLDNCEQVLAAGPEVAELLDACSGASILATSREPLRLRWEWEFPVRPLPRPEPLESDDFASIDALGRNESVALFVQRARAVQPSFALTPNNARAVAELCDRLDGLPLAIELAAARTRLLPPAVLLSRLERRLDLQSSVQDAPARHRTLREAIAWSYELLTTEQQALFRRLAVFVGGCTLEAAERVCFPRERREAPVMDVFEGMYALVERNLLTTEQPGDVTDDDGDPLVRFRFLETVREYALEQLELSGESGWVRAAHAAYYLALAEAAEPAVRGPRQRVWLDRLEQDWDNMRSVLGWLVERGTKASLDDMARLAWALWHFWWARGHLGEGRRWCNELLSQAPDSELSPRARARAAWVIATAALDQGDYEAAPPHIAECLALFEEIGDMRGMARGLLADGWAAPVAGDLQRALDSHHQSAECYREAGDEQGVVLALAGLGNTATLQQDLEAATRYNEEALELARRFGDTMSQAQVHEALGLVAYLQGDLDRAELHFMQSVPLCRAIGSVELQCYCLVGLAGVAHARGMPTRATLLLGAAEGLRERTGLGVWPVRQVLHDQLVRSVRGVESSEELAAAWATGRRMDAARAAQMALEPGFESVGAAPVSAVENGLPDASGLTAREQEVAALIAQGKTSKEIADALVITERTADTHAAHIREKLGLRSRAEIAAWATRLGLGVQRRP